METRVSFGVFFVLFGMLGAPGALQAEEWNFTWFGQSSKESLNRVEVLEANPLHLKLFSASFADGGIVGKGGKFTAFHDGLSFYYTMIDPQQNFELTATFTVDALNPVPDGQEGFGLLVLDSLGAPGVSSVNHYTNSAGLLATRFGSLKDTLGSRFVTGITSEVLGLGDSGIAKNAQSTSEAFRNEPDALVKQGGAYTLTLKKTNTGYHAVYQGVEHTLFGADKLTSLDAQHDYLGFAVARGCNVTVSDVVFKVTVAAQDAPGKAAPDVPVALKARVDSPAAFGDPAYPFVFVANADGRVSVVDQAGRTLIDSVVKAGKALRHELGLTVGKNDFTVKFLVDPGYRPGVGKRLRETEVQFVHTVYHRTYPGTVIHVSPAGSSLGGGTEAKPLDLATALAFVGPGQTIVLSQGTYRPQGPVVIARGNDGGAGHPKTLKAAPGERPVFDFSQSSGGMELWGNFWVLEGFDVTNTPGNVKGLQVAGSHNRVENVQTYRCGDTGLQISGTEAEGPDQWPADNLVLNSTSWGNNDPAQNNADGFAAKLTCGPGNVFRGCLSYSNIDDGWDLFSKIETGPIGAVTIDSCVSYRNGRLPDGTGHGDGNGFKLGGDGISVAHVLRNSIAFDNGASGITSNSDPAVILENNTAYANRQSNINLYGKTGARLFQAHNNLSVNGGADDVFGEMPELAADNFFWTAGQSRNAQGQSAGAPFVQTDLATVPQRRSDGSINMKGFLVLSPAAIPGVGSTLR